MISINSTFVNSVGDFSYGFLFTPLKGGVNFRSIKGLLYLRI